MQGRQISVAWGGCNWDKNPFELKWGWVEATNFLHETAWLIIAVGGNVSVTLCVCMCVWYDKHLLLLRASLQHSPPPLFKPQVSGSFSFWPHSARLDSHTGTHTVYNWLDQVSPPALGLFWQEEEIWLIWKILLRKSRFSWRGCGRVFTLLFGSRKMRADVRIWIADSAWTPMMIYVWPSSDLRWKSTWKSSPVQMVR